VNEAKRMSFQLYVVCDFVFKLMIVEYSLLEKSILFDVQTITIF